MSLTELINSIQYLVDTDGHKKAVVLDLAAWDEIVATLERLEPDTPPSPVKGDEDTFLPQQNQVALKLLESWVVEPDEMGQAWWDDFEQFLKENRFSLREVDLE